MSETDEYLDALGTFKKLDSEVDSLAKTLALVSESLKRDRASFMFGNVPTTLPATVVFDASGKARDGANWPSAQAINGLMERWRAAKNTMETTWHAIPEGRRNGLLDPPTLRRQ
jgi:hypothetical protein